MPAAKKPAPRKMAAQKVTTQMRQPVTGGASQWKKDLEKRLRSTYPGRRKDIVQYKRADWVRSQLDVVSESDYWNKPGVIPFSRKILNDVYTQVSKRADEARWEPGKKKKK
jgi:hypothetical protein